MANRKAKQIACDKHGNPLPPRDVSPATALQRAAVIFPLGVVLLVAGILMNTLIVFPESISGFAVIFAFMIFFGALFVLYGGTMIFLGLRGRAKEPSAEERMEKAKEDGMSAYATVTSIRNVNVRGRRAVKVKAVYYDELYRYKRKFVSDPSFSPAPAVGEKVRVWYHPDSNLGYYVEV